MKAVIETKSLTRKFGNLVAVDHVDFEVYQGEIFGFLGTNGAGKTTTVRLLTGVIDSTEGTATIQGHDIRKEPLLSRAHIAVVPEEANVYLDLSIWQNLMLMAELHGVARHRCLQEGERLLDALGLAQRKKQKARALSTGRTGSSPKARSGTNTTTSPTLRQPFWKQPVFPCRKPITASCSCRWTGWL